MASGKGQISYSKSPLVEVIVDDNPNSGVFNMAMDSALLELAADRNTSIVRIYEWSEPTVTLGYFQAAEPKMLSPFPELPTVRRLSGGGAILHHHEITYSLILPASHPARHDPSDVYEIVHQAIILLLSQTGLSCQLRSQFDLENTSHASPAAGQSTEPFLCFQRKNPNDIVHKTGIKVVGSAQRRRRGITLQHGSLILKASALAPQVLGIADLTVDFNLGLFRQSLPEVIAASIGKSLLFRGFSCAEMVLASDIANEHIEAESEKAMNADG